MNIGAFTTPNTKGQIVIPKKMRETLNITSQTNLHLVLKDGGIYIYPITDVVGNLLSENTYAKVLEKTRGAWRDGKIDRKLEEQRHKNELKATEENRKA